MAVPPSQAVMADAVKTPNVVEATNKPGLLDKLEDLKKRWVPCLCRTGTSQCRDPSAGQDEAKKSQVMGSHTLSSGDGAPWPHPARPATLEEATVEMTLCFRLPRDAHRVRGWQRTSSSGWKVQIKLGL